MNVIILTPGFICTDAIATTTDIDIIPYQRIVDSTPFVLYNETEKFVAIIQDDLKYSKSESNIRIVHFEKNVILFHKDQKVLFTGDSASVLVDGEYDIIPSHDKRYIVKKDSIDVILEQRANIFIVENVFKGDYGMDCRLPISFDGKDIFIRDPAMTVFRREPAVQEDIYIFSENHAFVTTKEGIKEIAVERDGYLDCRLPTQIRSGTTFIRRIDGEKVVFDRREEDFITRIRAKHAELESYMSDMGKNHDAIMKTLAQMKEMSM